MVDLESGGSWWRYHHLFQELLQHEINQHFDEDVIADLHVRAGTWYADHGLMDEAFAHLLAAKDIEAAVSLLERSRYAMMNTDQWHVVERWLARLPDPIKRIRPNLIMTQAWIAYYHHRLRTIPALLESIDEHLEEHRHGNALRAEVGFFQGLGLFWMGETAQALTLLDDARGCRSEADQMRGETELYFSVARQMMGGKEDALRFWYHVLYGSETPSPIRKTRLLGRLRSFTCSPGTWKELFEVAGQPKSGSEANNAYADAWFHYLLGLYHFMRNELDTARDYFAYAVDQRYVIHTRAAIDSMAGLALTYQPCAGQP
ncbi:MAG: hypothetical protein R2838_02680 [Caldilineaceae bacterium]